MLNNNQKLFCQELILNGKNQTQAYMEVYKNKNEETARKSASRLMTNVDVKEYVEQLQGKVEKKTIMTAEERMEWLSNVVNGKVREKVYIENINTEVEVDANVGTKIRAVDTLNKMEGIYTTKVSVTGIIGLPAMQEMTEEEIRKIANEGN